MKTVYIAPEGFFADMIVVSVAIAAIAAIVLFAMLISDWRHGKLW